MLLGPHRQVVAAEVLQMHEELGLLQNSCKCSLTVTYACTSEYTIREEGDTSCFLKVFGQLV